MAGACDGDGCSVGSVRYHTAVRLPLLDLSNGVKRQIWRDRQIQAQAYNWGVADALRVHYRGERIPSPRNHSTPLTQLRHKTGSVHSVLLQRGGFWSAVDAVKKWSNRRNQLVYAKRKAVDGTDKALNTLTAFTGKHPSIGAVSVQSRAMSEAVAQCRNAQRRRVELVESSDGNALRLRATPPISALVEMGADERAVMIAAAVERSDKALEVFNTALKTLRTKIKTVDSTEAARKRLRALADKIHKAVAVEAKADKRLLAHIAKGDERLFRNRRDTERCSGPALVLFDGCTISDGLLRLPSGTEIPLPAGIATVDDALASHQQQDLVWGGAVHVVDVTDTAGKVTRRTDPSIANIMSISCAAPRRPPRCRSLRPRSRWAPTGVWSCRWCAATARLQPLRLRRTAARQPQTPPRSETAAAIDGQQGRRQPPTSQTTTATPGSAVQEHRCACQPPAPRRQSGRDDPRGAQSRVGGHQRFQHDRLGGRNQSVPCARIGSQARAQPQPRRDCAGAPDGVHRAGCCHCVGGHRAGQPRLHISDLLRLRDTRATRDPSVVLVPGVRLVHPCGCASHSQRGRGRQPGLYPSAQDVTYGGRDSRHKMLEEAVGVFLDSTSADGSVTNKYARSGLAGHSGI